MNGCLTVSRISRSARVWAVSLALHTILAYSRKNRSTGWTRHKMGKEAKQIEGRRNENSSWCREKWLHASGGSWDTYLFQHLHGKYFPHLRTLNFPHLENLRKHISNILLRRNLGRDVDSESISVSNRKITQPTVLKCESFLRDLELIRILILDQENIWNTDGIHKLMDSFLWISLWPSHKKRLPLWKENYMEAKASSYERLFLSLGQFCLGKLSTGSVECFFFSRS